MNGSEKLPQIIATLQQSLVAGLMNKEIVLIAIKQLADIGYAYDHEAFPKLVNTETFIDNGTESPKDLAEALLWKLGKWKAYKKFVTQYTDDNSKPDNTNVVFFAFAKHLKNPDNPIYDQHAIRAMWAICGSLSVEEKDMCKQLLFKKNGEWKDTGSGRAAVGCYKMFLKYLEEIEKAGATKREIDLLLMPLGQAIKKNTNNYKQFCTLCGWSVNS